MHFSPLVLATNFEQRLLALFGSGEDIWSVSNLVMGDEEVDTTVIMVFGYIIVVQMA